MSQSDSQESTDNVVAPPPERMRIEDPLDEQLVIEVSNVVESMARIVQILDEKGYAID